MDDIAYQVFGMSHRVAKDPIMFVVVATSTVPPSRLSWYYLEFTFKILST